MTPRTSACVLRASLCALSVLLMAEYARPQ
jgi:hypothetical protein